MSTRHTIPGFPTISWHGHCSPGPQTQPPCCFRARYERGSSMCAFSACLHSVPHSSTEQGQTSCRAEQCQHTHLWSCGKEILQIPFLCHSHGAHNTGTSSSCVVLEVPASCAEIHLSPHPDTVLQPGSLESPSSSPRPRTVAQLEQNRMTGPRAGHEYSRGSEHLTSSKLSPLPSPRLVMGTQFDCL